jgi:hypothetical protein
MLVISKLSASNPESGFMKEPGIARIVALFLTVAGIHTASQSCTAQSVSLSKESIPVEVSIHDISFLDPFAAGRDVAQGALPEMDIDQLVSPMPKVAIRWSANLCHGTLFFEEPGLERFGISPGPVRQEIVSAGRFWLRASILPFTWRGWKALCGH